MSFTRYIYLKKSDVICGFLTANKFNIFIVNIFLIYFVSKKYQIVFYTKPQNILNEQGENFSAKKLIEGKSVRN